MDMVNNQQDPQLSTISFTQSELTTIINVFNACEIKLGDAVVMLPIVNKIFPHIQKKEPKVETNSVPTVESVSKKAN